MDLTDFVLARIKEEEAAWEDLGLQDPGLRLAMEKGLQRCGEKRRVVKKFRKDETAYLREALTTFALAYYDHPEFDPDWRIDPLR